MQFARSGFNAVTGTYNIRVRTFPDVLLARLMGMEPARFFQLDQQQEGQGVDVNAFLNQETEASQRSSQDVDDVLSTMSTTELFAAALFCVLYEDSELSNEELKRFYTNASALTGIGDREQLKALRKKIGAWVSAIGLEQAVIEVSKRLERLSGNRQAVTLITVMNRMAESDGEITITEEAMINKFRDALGGGENAIVESDEQANHPLEQEEVSLSDQHRLLMLALVSLVSADGEIKSEEFDSIVEFTIANTPLADRKQVRRIADSELERIKEFGLEVIVKEVVERLPNAFSKDVVAQLTQFITQLSKVDGEVHENEQQIATQYLKALRQN